MNFRAPPGAYHPPPRANVDAAVPGLSPAPGAPILTGDSEILEPASFQLLGLGGKPVFVAATTRRWTALDVFVSVSPTAPTAGALSVLVFAVNKGIRTLVGSGRVVLGLLSSAVGAHTVDAPIWACAVRNAFGETYEVKALYQQDSAFVTPQTTVDFVVAGSSEGRVADLLVGAVPMGPLLSANGVAASQGNQPIGGYSCPRLELLSLQAVNGAAAPRYLHLHDATDGLVAIAGLAPLMIWPLGESIGDGIVDDTIRYRARGVPRLVVSSTLLTTTEVADCAVSAVVR
jgi:hypothetical protein